MKLVFLLTALSVFLMLAYVAYPVQREEAEFPQAIEKQDFVFTDFVHNTTITGSWIDKDYLVQMQIKTIRIDLKLKYEFTEGSVHAHRETRQKEVDAEFSEFSHNATCSPSDAPKPSLRTRAWDYTVTTAKRVWFKCYDVVMTIVDGVWNGTVWLTECTWNGVKTLMEWAWDTLRTLIEWAWDTAKWTSEWINNGAVWIAEWVWDRVAWIGSPLVDAFNYVTEVVRVVGEFYDKYLKSHVRAVQAQINVLTWNDVFYTLVTVTLVNVALFTVYLFVKCTATFTVRRWQTWKERKAAANAPPAPKKPIWRPKPKKKKKRNNKNNW